VGRIENRAVFEVLAILETLIVRSARPVHRSKCTKSTRSLCELQRPRFA
jgi:hypothetical protein